MAGRQATALEDVEITVSAQGGGGRAPVRIGGGGGRRASLAQLGHEVARQQVRMPGGDTIRQVGEYAVTIHVSAEVEAAIRLKVNRSPPMAERPWPIRPLNSPGAPGPIAARS